MLGADMVSGRKHLWYYDNIMVATNCLNRMPSLFLDENIKIRVVWGGASHPHIDQFRIFGVIVLVEDGESPQEEEAWAGVFVPRTPSSKNIRLLKSLSTLPSDIWCTWACAGVRRRRNRT